jgi:hypothetical protein
VSPSVSPSASASPSIGLRIRQYSYRWRNNDGTEITATWQQAENEDGIAPIGGKIRLRILLDTNEDISSRSFELEFRRDGTIPWFTMPVE